MALGIRGTSRSPNVPFVWSMTDYKAYSERNPSKAVNLDKQALEMLRGTEEAKRIQMQVVDIYNRVFGIDVYDRLVQG